MGVCDVHFNFKILQYLFYLYIFSLELKIEICAIYIKFKIFFPNVQCYIVQLTLKRPDRRCREDSRKFLGSSACKLLFVKEMRHDNDNGIGVRISSSGD